MCYLNEQKLKEKKWIKFISLFASKSNLNFQQPYGEQYGEGQLGSSEMLQKIGYLGSQRYLGQGDPTVLNILAIIVLCWNHGYGHIVFIYIYIDIDRYRLDILFESYCQQRRLYGGPFFFFIKLDHIMETPFQNTLIFFFTLLERQKKFSVFQ